MQTLQLLLEAEETERDHALQRLQAAEDEARRARTQAEMLHTYRDEYRQRWSGQFARGGSMSVMQCYQGFMARLEQAIDQQRQQAEALAQRAEQCRQALAAQQVRVASVRTLIERREREQARTAERRERKVSDELAARAHRHAAAALAPALTTPGT